VFRERPFDDEADLLNVALMQSREDGPLVRKVLTCRISMAADSSTHRSKYRAFRCTESPGSAVKSAPTALSDVRPTIWLARD
jgi:hypothetical protein